jgi:hypothetical protein
LKALFLTREDVEDHSDFEVGSARLIIQAAGAGQCEGVLATLQLVGEGLGDVLLAHNKGIDFGPEAAYSIGQKFEIPCEPTAANIKVARRTGKAVKQT